MAEEKLSTGFFDDEEEITLSENELDNILNTSSIELEEMESASEIQIEKPSASRSKPSAQDDLVVKSGLELEKEYLSQIENNENPLENYVLVKGNLQPGAPSLESEPVMDLIDEEMDILKTQEDEGGQEEVFDEEPSLMLEEDEDMSSDESDFEMEEFTQPEESFSEDELLDDLEIVNDEEEPVSDMMLDDEEDLSVENITAPASEELELEDEFADDLVIEEEIDLGGETDEMSVVEDESGLDNFALDNNVEEIGEMGALEEEGPVDDLIIEDELDLGEISDDSEAGFLVEDVESPDFGQEIGDEPGLEDEVVFEQGADEVSGDQSGEMPDSTFELEEDLVELEEEGDTLGMEEASRQESSLSQDLVLENEALEEEFSGERDESFSSDEELVIEEELDLGDSEESEEDFSLIEPELEETKEDMVLGSQDEVVVIDEEFEKDLDESEDFIGSTEEELIEVEQDNEIIDEDLALDRDFEEAPVNQEMSVESDQISDSGSGEVIPEGFFTEDDILEEDLIQGIDDMPELEVETETKPQSVVQKIASSVEEDRMYSQKEVKEILGYLDSLFGYLPEDKIKEFAKSPYYDLYNKIFDDLGI